MPSSAPQLFITGGRGRLARLIAEGLADDVRVTAFSRTAGPGLEPLDRLLEPGTAAGGIVFHLAWSCLPVQAEREPTLIDREDIPLLRRLLAAVAATPAAVRPHFVFFSTGGAVYGDAPGRPNVETDACRPPGAYGRGKLAAERIVSKWARETGCGHTILRVSNPYGYTVSAERPQGIIPHAIRAAQTGGTLTLWGDGTARKDFLHYTDFLTAVREVIARRPAGTFNICRGESNTLLEVLTEVERQTGRTIRREHGAAAPWDVHDSRLSPALFSAHTGWQPSVSLSEGVRRSLEIG